MAVYLMTIHLFLNHVLQEEELKGVVILVYANKQVSELSPSETSASLCLPLICVWKLSYYFPLISFHSLRDCKVDWLAFIHSWQFSVFNMHVYYCHLVNIRCLCYHAEPLAPFHDIQHLAIAKMLVGKKLIKVEYLHLAIAKMLVGKKLIIEYLHPERCKMLHVLQMRQIFLTFCSF